MQCCGTTRPSTTDDQDITGIVRREISIVLDRAIALQQGRKLDDGFVALIGTEFDWPVGAGPEIWMVLMNQLIAVCRRKLGDGLLAPGIPRLVYDLLERMNIHSVVQSLVNGYQSLEA